MADLIGHLRHARLRPGIYSFFSPPNFRHDRIAEVIEDLYAAMDELCREQIEISL